MSTPTGDTPNLSRLLALAALTASYECPDCLADTRLVEHAQGVYVLQVMHDDTCPQLLAHERRRR